MLELSVLHVSNKLPHIVTCRSGIDVSNYNHLVISLRTFFYCLSVASKVECHRHQSTWLVQFPHSWLGVTNNSTIAQQTPTLGTCHVDYTALVLADDMPCFELARWL